MNLVPPITPQLAKKTAKARQFSLARFYLVRCLASLYLPTKTVKDRICVWPPYNEDLDADDLSTLLANAKHYLNGLHAPLELFLQRKDGLVLCSSQPPYASVVRHQSIAPEAAQKGLARARFSVFWQMGDMRWGSSYRPYIYNIERGAGRYDVNEWLRLTKDLYFERYTLQKNRVLFPQYPVNSCAVLGTGPSYEHFLDESHLFDAWIGANSIVCDERVRRLGHPFAVCMLDPYLFAPLDSMRPTIEGMFALLRETPAVLITVNDFAPFIELNFPEDVKRKCHYLSTMGHDGITIGLSDDLRNLMVTPYGNVLTDLMLPVAAAISRKIVVYGCDGKKPGPGCFFEKGETILKVDNTQNEDLASVIDHGTYDNYIYMHNIFTRYVVDQCLGMGRDITLRRHSWNAGLKHLTVASNCDE